MPSCRGARLALVAITTLIAGCGAHHRGAARPATQARLVAIGAGLHGPATLRATVYATGLTHASAFALDRRGRLWVTTSAASGHAHDGVFVVARAGARPVKVIAGLKGPLGLTWVGATLYVASIGRIDAFGDLHGGHFAHRRTVLTEPAGHGWNDNLIRIPDGRLVVSISAPCDHCTPRSRFAASLIALRPDGRDVRVWAKGIRAGYGLARVPGSDDLYVSMNQRDDLGARTPGDWLARVREGQDWGFPACYGQGGAACAGVPRPIGVLDRHAAAGGVVVVGGPLAAGARRSALVAEWATGKVKRVALTATASTPKGGVTTLLTGVRDPLALIAHGNRLLVGDWATGTVYAVTPRRVATA